MIRSRLATVAPRRLAALAIVALIAVLAGCEAGNAAPTEQWHQPTAGSDAVLHDISITNVFVLGAPVGQTIPAGGSASLFMSLFNNGSPDTLTKVSAPGTAKSVTLLRGPVKLPSQQSVLLTGPAPEVILNGLTHSLVSGSTLHLVLNFQNSGSKPITVPVMPRSADYATDSPPPSPSPMATAQGKAASPKSSPTPAASASASASPSPSPTP